MKFVRIYLLLLLFFGYVRSQRYCSKGHRVYTPNLGPDVCLSCDDGVNFISEQEHSHRECNNCTQVTNPDLEIVISNCTINHDTVILCKPGYYRIKASNRHDKGKCVKCTECKSHTRECEGYHDTVCCSPNFEVVLSGHEYVCQEKPIVCGPGHYFKQKFEECLPCPDGTYMIENIHRCTQCLKCGVLSGELAHAVIIRSCNKTSPTLFGCEPGYFRDTVKESLQIEVTCSPCQKCDKQIRECDMFHDTICGIQEYRALVSDTVTRTYSDIEDSMSTMTTGKTGNIQINMHTTKVKTSEDKDAEKTITKCNDQIMDHKNAESSLKNQEKGIYRDNEDGAEYIVLTIKICVVLNTVAAIFLEGYIVYSFFCTSTLSRSSGIPCMKFHISMYRKVQNRKRRMVLAIIYQQFLCAYLVYNCIQYFCNSYVTYLLIWFTLAVISFYNTQMFMKFLRCVDIIEKHTHNATDSHALIELTDGHIDEKVIHEDN